MPKATKSYLKHTSKLSKGRLLTFAILFGLIGGYVILRSFAAPNPNLPGDLNADNTVNVSDLSILLGAYGTTNTNADINKDGTVNILDLSILLAHYGTSYIPPPPPSGGPFLPSSAINQPIPSGVAIHPDTTSMIQGSVNWVLPSTSPYKEWLGPRNRTVFQKTTSFSGIPTVQIYVNYTDGVGYKCATTPITIPWPSIFASVFTTSNSYLNYDGISYISDGSGNSWEGYRVTAPGIASKDISCSSSRWNAVRMDYWPGEEVSGVGYGHGSGESASDILSGAGLLRPTDFTNVSVGSVIPHVLRLNAWSEPATSGSPHPHFVCPADSSDNAGPFTDLRAIPIGARVQLDPSINVDTWASVNAKSEPWQSALKKILRTLQVYGAVYVDSSGGQGSGGLEAANKDAVLPYVYPWEQSGNGWAYGNGVPYDLMSHFRVVDWNSWTGC